MEMTIRCAKIDDARAMARIYNHYVANTAVTFEEDPVSADDMTQRLLTIQAGFPALVCCTGEQLLGYAYVSPWRVRTAYRYSVESTVYLDHAATGRGLGTALYGDLLALLKSTTIHTVVAGISLPNQACIAVHEKFGFTKVAELKQIGKKFGEWLDVGYWQKLM